MAATFDLGAYVRASTAASGVPERVEDADVIREAVSLLLAMHASKSQLDQDRSAKTAPKPDRSKS